MRFASGASLDIQLRIPDAPAIANGISVDDSSDRSLSPCASSQLADLGVRYGIRRKLWTRSGQDRVRGLRRARHEAAWDYLVDGQELSAKAHQALPADGYAVSRMRRPSDDIAGNWHFQSSLWAAETRPGVFLQARCLRRYGTGHNRYRVVRALLTADRAIRTRRATAHQSTRLILRS